MDPMATTEANDWRAYLMPAARERVVNKISETLQKHLPVSNAEGLKELQKIATRFEEKIFASATSQRDYLNKISLKMLSMESKAQHAPATSNTTATIEVVGLKEP
ncbi:mediator of RNA polymerase II transcription subunit 15a isoform X2 [Typha latifolia]|uniref:mediator of RNA polymerase II transcription subunit 15a isoform X2 n=1 Tax=Typha latifolia TaxID=4733 RepID=UPI003C2F1CEB